jgi:hypothetical protein
MRSVMPNDRVTNHHSRNHRHNFHGLELRTVSAPKKTAGSFSSAGVLDSSSYGVCSSLHPPRPAHPSFSEMFIPVLPMFIIVDNREVI